MFLYKIAIFSCYRHIQGCPFDGPIPSSISALTSLRDLYAISTFYSFVILQEKIVCSFCFLFIYMANRRISDLKGGESSFPPLRDMESMKTL